MEKLRFMAVLILVIVLVSPQFMMLSEAQNTSILYPIRDSWIEAENPNTNHGSETVLKVKADSRVRRAYLTFDLSSIPVGKVITSVKLYLYCTTVDSNPTVVINAHETQDSWTESTITWNNAPSVGAYITQTSVGASGQYYSWNITSYGLAQYQGDKLLSIVVKLPQDDPSQNNPNYARDFASKEYTGTTQDPYLEVTYNDSPPVASFSYSPNYPMANDTVIFNATASYDPDGNIVSYEWNFGDGNITTVTNPIVTHVYSTYGNYTVTLKVTDNFGLTDAHVEIVEVLDPAVLHVSLPEGTYVKQSVGDPWIDEGWLLYKTGNSWSFTVKIYDTSSHVKSYDTHVIVALSDGAYNNLLSLSINGTNIAKTAFKYGKPKPYGTKYWSDCIYPAWFNDTYVNVGYIPPKGYKTLTVSVTFSDATDARMHFDAYGSTYNGKPCSWSQVTWSPNSEDSTVLYKAGPLPLSVSISPPSAVIDLGQSVSFTSTVSGGTPPYSYQWYVNNTAVSGANSSSWTFTPTSAGYYNVHLNVTDSLCTKAKSNISPVTVNPPLSVSINPTSAVIKLGQSVLFTSTVSGGTPPYSYQWYLNETAVPGANSSSWTFTPTSTGYYVVFLKVTDYVSSTAVSNYAYVTVNLPDYYLTVKTDPIGITSISGEGWYSQGTNVTLTAPAIVSVSEDTQYRFSYWDVDGTSQGLGVNPIHVIMNANHTATAHYALQYRVTFAQTGLDSTAIGTVVTVNGGGKVYGDLPYRMWVDVSSSVLYSYNSIVSSSVSGKRFSLVSVTGPASPIYVTSPVTVTGNYKTQYYLTLLTNPPGVTTPSGSGWYDAGTNAPISTPEDVLGGSRYHFVGWVTDDMSEITNPNSPSTTVLIDKPKTVTANYVHQYLVTFTHTGLTGDASGTVVTVNSTSKTYSDLPYSIWVDENGIIYYSYETIVSSTMPGKQFKLSSVTGPSSPITVTADTTVTGNYIIQYEVTFAQTGLDSSATGTVATVNGVPVTFGEFNYKIWVNNNGGVTYFYSNVSSTTSGKRFILTGVTGPASPITVTSPVTVTGNYKTQYQITVTASPSGALGGTFKVTYTQCGTTYTNVLKTTSWTEWADGGTTVTVSEPQDIVNGYKFDSYNPSATVTMDQAKTITLVYKAVQSLSVSISPTSAKIKVGESVTFTSTVSGGVPGYSYKWYLNGTEVSGAISPTWTFTPVTSGTYNVYLNVTDSIHNTAKSNIAPVTVAPPLKVSISPTSASILVGQSVTFTSSVSGGYPTYSYQWYLGGVQVSGATSGTWTFTPTASGIYYVYLQVKDANNNIAQSETARVVVSGVSFGGYSVSLTKPVAKTPLICYAMLLAIFSVMISLIKRKRK
jgi:PKD repeat protein